jgi:hypothetical protein
MKKTLISIFVATFTILFTTGAFAGWVLYDDFNRYADIEELKASPKWFISADDEAIADFSIENGRLKIVHKAGKADDSAWAQLTKKTKNIIGVSATMEVESWDGDVRVRIGADYGVVYENSDHLVWYQMQLRHRYADWLLEDQEYVTGNISVLDIQNDFNWLYDLFYTELGNGKRIIAGVPFTITAKWRKKQAFFGVDNPDDVGRVEFWLTEKIDKIDEPFRAIGTRSGTDDGTCVVYIDDVYVYKYRHRHWH